MSNEQFPNPKEAPIPKLETSDVRRPIGIWNLGFLWRLVLGHWKFWNRIYLVFGFWCFVSSPIIERVFALNYSPVNARKPISRAVLLSGLVLSSGFLLGQGTIQFDNLVVGVLDYPISDCHGPLSGPGWSAQIWGALLGTPEENLEP